MSNIDLTGLPDDPEIDLDQWISDRLPIENAEEFYSEALTVEPNYCRKPKETWFMYGVHSAAYGQSEGISYFLSEDSYFETLTKPKRQLIAWILNNPRSNRPKQHNTRSRMHYFAHMVAELTVWCGYGKTEAIETIVDNYLYRPGEEPSQAAADAKEQRRESLRAQIFREIGKGGKAHDYYQRQVADIEYRLEETNRLRAERHRG
jgi:hypothetical protein